MVSSCCFPSCLLSLSVCAWSLTQNVFMATSHLIARGKKHISIRFKVRPKAKLVVSMRSVRGIQHAWVSLSSPISWTFLAHDHWRAKFKRPDVSLGNRHHVPYFAFTRSYLCAGAQEGKGRSLRVSIRAARNIPQELIGLSLYVTLEAKAPDPSGDLKSSIAEKYPFGESCVLILCCISGVFSWMRLPQRCLLAVRDVESKARSRMSFLDAS